MRVGHVIADIPDGVVQELQCLRDLLAGRLLGFAGGGVQAQARVEKAADDLIEQVLAVVRPSGSARRGGVVTRGRRGDGVLLPLPGQAGQQR